MKPIATDTLLALIGRWSAGRGPLYLLLAGRLRQLIEAGELPDRTPLPPDRTLAAALAIGRSTVVAAYDVLRQEGRLTRTQGSGTRVSADLPKPGVVAARNPLFLHLLDTPDDGVLQLTCAGPDMPPPTLLDAHRSALTDLAAAGHIGLGYHPAGLPKLRAALADHYTARGLPTGPEQILVSTGAQQALALLTRLLVRPGDQVLTEAPTYPGALELFREANAVLRPIPVTAPGLDVDACDAALATGRPALAYLTASFHNPTGALLHDLARRRLARSAAAAGVPLIDDEALVGLGFRTLPAPMAAGAPAGAVITVGSLSKLVWGGFRIGWVRADAALIGQLARLKATHDLSGDLLAQLAATHLVPRYAELRRARVTALRASHDQLCAELTRQLPDWRFHPAEGGQTLWVRLPGADASLFSQTALRHGVAVLPGSAFDPTPASRDHIRIPYLANPDVITDAVTRLAAAWPLPT